MLLLQQNFLQTLRRTQWLPPEKLLGYQARLLEDIARHAYTFVPFYRERLAPLFRQQACNLAAWREVPIVTRADIEAHGSAMRALAVPLTAARETDGRTSGTTGPALDFAQSELVGLTTACLVERMLEAHKFDHSGHMARIRPAPAGSADYPDGREDQGWNLSHPHSRWSKLGIHASVEEQLEWLVRRAPRYLNTRPSTAAALARHALATGRSLALERISTIGEVLEPDALDDIRRAFGCDVADNYGMNEAGYLGFQCPEGGGYHVSAEAVLIELLDDDGNPAAEGALGRIIISSFYNFAMPFLRYETGDFAVAAAGPCPCGRTLPRLQTIMGRQRDIFTLPDGSQYATRRWRAAFMEALQAKQMQFIQSAPDAIEIRYVPKLPAGEPPDASVVERLGHSIIHASVLCTAVAVPEIPRSPSGKFQDSISLVGKTADRK